MGSSAVVGRVLVQCHSIVVVAPPEQSIAADVLDEKAPGGVVYDHTRSQSHHIVVSPDTSIVVEDLYKKTP